MEFNKLNYFKNLKYRDFIIIIRNIEMMILLIAKLLYVSNVMEQGS